MTTQEVEIPVFLFVDDDPDIREVLKVAGDEFRQYNQVDIRTAENGKEAVDMLDAIARDTYQRIDGVFLDVNLKGVMTSLELFHWIRGHERLGHTPITVCTGFSAAVIPTELAGLPMLSKPFNIDSLIVEAKAMLSPR